MWIFSPRQRRIIGTAESNNTNHVIEVIYTDYGGSYAENGGVHVDIFLKERGLFAYSKKDITGLVYEVIPCSSAVGRCTRRVYNGQLDYCEGDSWFLDDGSQACGSKKLEDFEINNDKLIWYGKHFEL